MTESFALGAQVIDIERRGATLEGNALDDIEAEALESAEEFARFRDAVEGPLLANMTEFGKSPLLGFDELAAIGYSLVLYPVTLLRLAMKAVQDGLYEIRHNGTQADLLARMLTRQELYDILGYADYERRDQTLFQPDGKP